MMNSRASAQQPHEFIYRGWEVRSQGNPFTHAILRGFKDRSGLLHSNYHFDDLNALFEEYEKRSLSNPGVIVDTNHANSGKRYVEQGKIAKDVLSSCRVSKSIKSLVKGFMIESYIENGCQKVGGGVYGQSITDPCLGWKETEKLFYELAELI